MSSSRTIANQPAYSANPPMLDAAPRLWYYHSPGVSLVSCLEPCPPVFRQRCAGGLLFSFPFSKMGRPRLFKQRLSVRPPRCWPPPRVCLGDAAGELSPQRSPAYIPAHGYLSRCPLSSKLVSAGSSQGVDAFRPPSCRTNPDHLRSRRSSNLRGDYIRP